MKKPTKAKSPALVGKAKLMAGKGQGNPGSSVASGSEYPTGSFGGGKVTDRGIKRK